MRILLDTHVLIWALSDPGEISEDARRLIVDPEVPVLVSAATAWEIAVKQSLGKVVLPRPAEIWLPRAVASAGFEWLAITHEDALRTRALPWHHRDPFDRLLVAQAMRGLTIATRDEMIARYGVPVMPA